MTARGVRGRGSVRRWVRRKVRRVRRKVKKDDKACQNVCEKGKSVCEGRTCVRREKGVAYR